MVWLLGKKKDVAQKKSCVVGTRKEGKDRLIWELGLLGVCFVVAGAGRAWHTKTGGLWAGLG